MGIGPLKRMVTLGVNSLARETGLPRQTVSDRMRKGATASEIRLYAAMRERRTPERTLGAVAKRREAPKSRESRIKFGATLMMGDRLEAIEDFKLRRAQALAEKLEMENQQLRSQLVPRVYLREWGAQFLAEARNELSKGPSELCEQMAMETDPMKCANIIGLWTERVIAKFHSLDHLWRPDLNNGVL